jgi:hypothetical protein
MFASSSSVGTSGIRDSARCSIVSSLITLPCMIQSIPADTAASTSDDPRAWMVIRLPSWWARSATDFISSVVNAW